MNLRDYSPPRPTPHSRHPPRLCGRYGARRCKSPEKLPGLLHFYCLFCSRADVMKNSNDMFRRGVAIAYY